MGRLVITAPSTSTCPTSRLGVICSDENIQHSKVSSQYQNYLGINDTVLHNRYNARGVGRIFSRGGRGSF